VELGLDVELNQKLLQILLEKGQIEASAAGLPQADDDVHELLHLPAQLPNPDD
jgi:hypothetical protein